MCVCLLLLLLWLLRILVICVFCVLQCGENGQEKKCYKGMETWQKKSVQKGKDVQYAVVINVVETVYRYPLARQNRRTNLYEVSQKTRLLCDVCLWIQNVML